MGCLERVNFGGWRDKWKLGKGSYLGPSLVSFWSEGLHFNGITYLLRHLIASHKLGAEPGLQ